MGGGPPGERTRGFEAIGSDHEQAPLLLADYLSYDEIQLSALISVAVPTLFVNVAGSQPKLLVAVLRVRAAGT